VCGCLSVLLPLGAASEWEQCYRDGLAARKLGRYQDARRLLETALAESGLAPLDVRRAQVDTELASVLNILGDANRAERLYLEAVAILQTQTPRDPALESVLLGEFGAFQETQGRLDAAEELLRRAIDASQVAFGERHPSTATAQVSLAHLYVTAGRLAEAEPLLGRAVVVHRKVLAAADIDRLASESSLGVVYLLEGRYDLAEPILQQATRGARELGEDHPVYAMTLANLADLYRFAGDSARGEPLLRKALAIYESKLGPEAPAVAEVLLDMSITSIWERKPSVAESQIRRALDILKKTRGPDHTTVAVGECRLAQALVLDHRYTDAEKLLDHAVSVFNRSFPSGHRMIGECLYHVGEAEEAQHRWIEACRRYQESIAIFERTTGSSPPVFVAALQHYARLLRANHRKAEAKSMTGRAREMEKAAGSLH
jgi:tetratricopeptide (TPR) repeat protein